MIDFNQLTEGTSLAGYTLERRIRDDGAAAIFEAISNDGERVLLKLVPVQDSNAGRQYAIWDRSRHLRHPNLLEFRDVGRADDYVFAAFEHPDDELASALKNGPLSEDETRGVLQSALNALRYLHSQGMVHGAVTPEHIVAVGDAIKLTTEGLRESDDLDGCAEDVRQLGNLLRALRAPERLGEPLATIARHAAAEIRSQRWTLAEIAAALEPPPAPAPVARPPIPPARPVVQLPPPVAEPLPPPAASVEPAAPERRPIPKWIFAGVAALLLVILGLNLRRRPEPAPHTAIVPQTTPPAVSRPVAAPPPAPSHLSARASIDSVWRVIAFTFPSPNLASKKAAQINHRWPSLHATVFSPKGRRGYYLVALGDRMTRDQAAQLQHKARRMGLPRDTYIQNYNE